MSASTLTRPFLQKQNMLTDTSASNNKIESFSHKNNFTLLRLMLAFFVLMFHFKVLGKVRGAYWPMCYPDLAVDCFFVVSGCLIYASFDTKPMLREFYIRRIFRLYPLLFVVIVLQTLLMAVLQHAAAVRRMPELGEYFLCNAAFVSFLKKDVGGVLAVLPFSTLNPSVWTLKVEVLFYLLVPAIRWCVRRFGNRFLLAAFIVSAAYTFAFRHAGRIEMSRQFPGAVQFFAAGIAMHVHRDRFARLPGWLVACLGLGGFGLATVIVLCEPFPGVEALRLALPAASLAIVYGIAIRTPPIGLKRDFSYGVYLLHGPLIQVLILAGWYRFSLPCFGLVAAATLCLGLLAETLVERPGIRIGRRIALSPPRSDVAFAPAP